jgi:hypothetical protein
VRIAIGEIHWLRSGLESGDLSLHFLRDLL